MIAPPDAGMLDLGAGQGRRAAALPAAVPSSGRAWRQVSWAAREPKFFSASAFTWSGVIIAGDDQDRVVGRVPAAIEIERVLGRVGFHLMAANR